FGESEDSAQCGQSDKNKYRRLVVARKELHNRFSIQRPESREKRVTDSAPERKRTNKLLLRILQRPSRQQHRHQRKWRRQHRANCHRLESPVSETRKYFLRFFLVQFALGRLLPTFSSERIGNVAAEHGPSSRHQRVIRPQVSMSRCQPHRQHVHAAGQWNDRIVRNPEHNQSRSAQLHEPAPNHKQRNRGRRIHFIASGRYEEFVYWGAASRSPKNLVTSTNRKGTSQSYRQAPSG